MSAVAGPSRPAGDFSSKGGPRSRYQNNVKKYGTPLPILLSTSPLHPAYNANAQSRSYLSSLFSSTPRPIIPQCKGTFDPVTRSVIVDGTEDMEILFRRGFFGKGTLSRSEPTWRARRIDIVKGGESVAAEKIREKRRLERKQFKIDRAAAMLDAAKAAEAVITTGQVPTTATGEMAQVDGADDDNLGDEEEMEDEDDGRSVVSQATTAATATTVPIDISTLTPQTFLVRPTRPDANRNRGKNAFKRKPKPKPPAQSQPHPPAAGPAVPDSAQVAKAASVEEDEDHDELEEFDESLVEEMEHLQLGLEEAWFLSEALGVLRIYDRASDTLLPSSAVLPLLLTPPSLPPAVDAAPRLLPDDPFLVSYVAYHHFRSLGWVVKPGVKFCSDWLLYRRGPVFSHAAFSCVVVPVYMDAQDRETSPYGKEDWYEERMSWKWMNTIMRVNSLVQKTVIMVYVTIPSRDSIPDQYKIADGSLSFAQNDMATLLKRYTVREVSLQRFGPARRRD